MAKTVHVADSPPPPPSKGIFWDLLGGQPDGLVQDVLEHPDRYSADLVTLARDLIEQRRKVEDLSYQEQELLNRGSFEFYQYRPSATEKPKAPAKPPRPSSQTSKPVEPPPAPEPGVDVPEGAGPRPYWWT